MLDAPSRGWWALPSVAEQHPRRKTARRQAVKGERRRRRVENRTASETLGHSLGSGGHTLWGFGAAWSSALGLMICAWPGDSVDASCCYWSETCCADAHARLFHRPTLQLFVAFGVGLSPVAALRRCCDRRNAYEPCIYLWVIHHRDEINCRDMSPLESAAAVDPLSAAKPAIDSASPGSRSAAMEPSSSLPPTHTQRRWRRGTGCEADGNGNADSAGCSASPSFAFCWRPEGGDPPSAGALLTAVRGASDRARPPVSRYNVGAVGVGLSGRVYCGLNLEFLGAPMSSTVHAEQVRVTWEGTRPMVT